MSKKNKLFSWLGLGKKKSTDSNATEPVVLEDNIHSEQEQPTAAVAQAITDTDATDIDLQRAEAETTDVAKPPLQQQAEADKVEAVVAKSDIASSESEQPVESEPAEAEQPESAYINPVQLDDRAQSSTVVAAGQDIDQPVAISDVAVVKKVGFFARLKQGLAKTSQNLGAGLAGLFTGRKIDEELYEELETQLLLADLGVETTQKLIGQLERHADRKSLKDATLLFDKLQQDMAVLLHGVEQPLVPECADGPFVILMIGVNGVGKTTTIGKMAQQYKQQGKSVMLAAGDTFRAAAVEQLQVWGERNAIPVIAQHTGADSASVIFDAYQAAKARKVDVLIADTAGRLQNKSHLMEELKKIVRVLQKIQPNAPHEVMLTLDAGTGQNALSQAKAFNEAVPLTGISLTKLDGTAKGGVIFAIADKFSLPIRYIGVGEGIEDLREFNSKDFIQALFNREL